MWRIIFRVMLDDLKRGRCWHLGKLRLSETNRNSYKELLVRKESNSTVEKNVQSSTQLLFYWKRVLSSLNLHRQSFFKTQVKRVMSVRLQTVLFTLVTDPLSGQAGRQAVLSKPRKIFCRLEARGLEKKRRASSSDCENASFFCHFYDTVHWKHLISSVRNRKVKSSHQLQFV